MMKEKLILASQSSSRAHLLKAAGFANLIQIPSNVDEDKIKKEFGRSCGGEEGSRDRDQIEDLALSLASAKALKVSAEHPEAWVIGADQLLVFENKTYDKAKTIAEARALFLAMRGKKHFLIGGQVVARDNKICWRHSSKVALVVRSFSETLLDDYLALMGERVLEAVGGYQLEGAGVQFFDSIKGDYFSILGLDMLALLRALRDVGAIRK